MNALKSKFDADFQTKHFSFASVLEKTNFINDSKLANNEIKYGKQHLSCGIRFHSHTSEAFL